MRKKKTSPSYCVGGIIIVPIIIGRIVDKVLDEMRRLGTWGLSVPVRRVVVAARFTNDREAPRSATLRASTPALDKSGLSNARICDRVRPRTVMSQISYSASESLIFQPLDPYKACKKKSYELHTTYYPSYSSSSEMSTTTVPGTSCRAPQVLLSLFVLACQV